MRSRNTNVSDVFQLSLRAPLSRCAHRLVDSFATLRRILCGLLLLGSTALSMAPAQGGTVSHIYDELGRLVQSVAPNGDSVRYTYDAVGNIKSVQRFASGTLSISEFTPNSGAAGSSVTLYGSGFSATPGSNSVKFNGTAATVSAATTTQLSVTVPAAATTGPISVTVGANTATSSQNFTVASATGLAPAISSFTPANGGESTVVTINGSNFDPDKANDLVRINGDALPIQSATATQLKVTITAQATSGKFVVTTPYGSVTSSADFFIPPENIANADITKRGRITVGGATVAVSGLTAGKYAQYLFDGTAGQNLGLGISVVSTNPADGGGSLYVVVKKPDGSDLSTTCSTISTGASGDSCNLPKLPVSGTYQLILLSDPGHTNNFSMTLSSDLAATLTANSATPTTFSITRPGQNGRYTFSGTAGKAYSLLFDNTSFIETNWVTVYTPDGSTLAGGNISTGYPTTIDLPPVPATGTYTVFIDPSQVRVGQTQLWLRADATGTLTIDGTPTTISLLPGQNGRYTFSGTSGQYLGLGITNLSTVPENGYVSMRILSPFGTNITQYGDCAAAQGNCNLPKLPASGTYTVIVDPGNGYSTNLTLSLSKATVGTLTVNAATSTSFNATRAGQDGYYTFSASAGQNYSLAISGVTIPTPSQPTQISIIAPDGSFPAGRAMYVGDTGSIELSKALAGTYTVAVDPASGNTGQVQLAVRSDAPGTLAINGAATNVSLLPGQNARFTFSGTTGQRLGLGISALSPIDATVYIRIKSPVGQLLLNCDAMYGCMLPTLPASGTYVVEVDPYNLTSTSMALTLSTDLTGTLSVDASNSTALNIARAGQNARYTFSATAGNNYEVDVSGTTIPGSWTYATVLAPNGAYVGSAITSTDSPTTNISLNNLPATGPYSVVVDPAMSNTGSLQLKVSSAGSTPPAALTPNGSLSIGGSPLSISVPANQVYYYTFSGTAGQKLGLGISNLATSPSGNALNVWILRPDNISTQSSCYSNTADFSCNLETLPSTGTYVIAVQTYDSSATAKLTLSQDLAGTLSATPLTFSTSRAGQNGRYTFSGTAGQRYSLVWTNSTIPGNWSTLTVTQPDGTYLIDRNFDGDYYATGSLDLGLLPATGTYTVFVDPLLAQTGQVKLALQPAASAALTINGASTAVALSAGQIGRYTFSGTAGQTLGLGINAATVAPEDAYLTTIVYQPDGTLLTYCGAFRSEYSCNIDKLPVGGTYSIVISTNVVSSASFTLTLSTDLAATLTANAAAPTLFSSARAGQNGRYTFSGTAGQRYAISWSDATLALYWNQLTVYKPDGSTIDYRTFGESLPTGTLELGVLPLTGTYTVFVDPYSANTGQVKLSLGKALTGTLVLGNAPVSITLATGQPLEYSFAGTTGQNLGVQFSELVTSPADPSTHPLNLDLIGVTGNVLTTCPIGGVGYNSCRFPTLPASGTYKLVLRTGPNTASFKLQLKSSL